MENDNIKVNDLPDILDLFKEKALIEFGYLYDFGFKKPEIQTGNTSITLKYLNSKIEVRINYSILDQYIYINILRVFGEGEVAQLNDYDNVISLSGLIFNNELSLQNVKKLYIYHGHFEHALKKSAYFLKKYGEGILSGVEWISERQVQQKYRKR